jgi:hypothetical protein
MCDGIKIGYVPELFLTQALAVYAGLILFVLHVVWMRADSHMAVT